MFCSLVEPERNGSICQSIQIRGDIHGIDKVGVDEGDVIFFSIDEQSKHDEFEKVIESAWVFYDEGHSLFFLELASNYLGGTLDDGVLFLGLVFS